MSGLINVYIWTARVISTPKLPQQILWFQHSRWQSSASHNIAIITWSMESLSIETSPFIIWWNT